MPEIVKPAYGGFHEHGSRLSQNYKIFNFQQHAHIIHQKKGNLKLNSSM